MELIESGSYRARRLGRRCASARLALELVREGVISGLGSVLVFVPQILTLFFFIMLLEDFGYMARAAFLMDRIMGGRGLHGPSLHPAVVELCLRDTRASWRRG